MPYSPQETGTCPHCQTAVRFEPIEVATGFAKSSASRANFIQIKTQSNCQMRLEASACPNCGRAVLYLTSENIGPGLSHKRRQLLWPDTTERPVPSRVIEEDPDLAEEVEEGEEPTCLKDAPEEPVHHERKSWHAYRAGLATRLHDKGLSLKAIGDYAGWKNTRTLETVYLERDPHQELQQKIAAVA